MSERFSGGIISKTPVTPSGPYETDSASGIWTLDQQMQYAKQGIWPTAGRTAPDAQFNYVTMLLHGDGTNGAQNNTFLDSSTNNFTITRNGNTTQGSFSPYGANWSNYFDGSGDVLKANSNVAFQLNADFTVEGWSYPVSPVQQYQSVFTIGAEYSVGNNIILYFNHNDNPNKYLLYVNSTLTLTGTIAPGNDTWNHFALTRSGNTWRLFVNGVLDVSTTRSGTIFSSNPPVVIASESPTRGITDFTGYLSNFRIVKDTALYTSAFTPPTAPLTAISGTSLLTCQSNRFIDNSINAFSIAVTGAPSVQRFNPFGASTAYSTSVIGGSGYFPSVSTGLAVNNSSCMVFSGNFTIEAWCYQFTADQKVLCGQLSASNFQIQFNQSNVAGRTGIYNNSVWTTLDCSSSPVNQWFHLAYSRSGSTVYIYLNGVLQGTISVSGTLSFSGTNGGGIGALAGYWDGGWIGYISSFQSSNVAKYTGSNFTPPTAPPTAVSSTTVLANMTNGAIYDNAMMNDLETVGNAQISTSVVKYGTGSMYFDGTGDWLSILNTPTSTVWGTESWTIEGWIYPTAVDSTYRTLYVNGYPIQIYQKGGSVEIYISSTNGFSYIVNGLTGPTFSVAANTWTHFAVVKNGNDYKVYVNGIGGSTVTSSTAIAYTSATNAFIGDASIFGSYPFAGYIDDFRITKGYARYTANFTPPTAAFPNTGPT